MNTQFLDYADGDIVCEAYIAYDESKAAKRPAVLIAHQWSGQSDAERKKAEQLAELGYVGFAIDMFGKGVRGGSTEENSKLIEPLMKDRALLRRRILAAVAAAKSHPMIDADRIGAIGFCFGGLCALDLARSAAAGLQGVVSFHGLLLPPNLGAQPPITAKTLILHGYDDPMAPPEHVLAIAKELTAAGADWQLHAYGNTVHAFTAKGANDPALGLRYNEAADRRSWIAMKNFFEEVLG